MSLTTPHTNRVIALQTFIYDVTIYCNYSGHYIRGLGSIITRIHQNEYGFPNPITKITKKICGMLGGLIWQVLLPPMYYLQLRIGNAWIRKSVVVFMNTGNYYSNNCFVIIIIDL